MPVTLSGVSAEVFRLAQLTGLLWRPVLNPGLVVTKHVTVRNRTAINDQARHFVARARYHMLPRISLRIHHNRLPTPLPSYLSSRVARITWQWACGCVLFALSIDSARSCLVLSLNRPPKTVCCIYRDGGMAGCHF